MKLIRFFMSELGELIVCCVFLQDVMYLMIVNMPSEVELATAKRELEQEKN